VEVEKGVRKKEKKKERKKQTNKERKKEKSFHLGHLKFCTVVDVNTAHILNHFLKEMEEIGVCREWDRMCGSRKK
jgi:hypothetical protein